MSGTGGEPAPTSASSYEEVERLVGASVTGDRESFALLYDRTAPRVLGLVSGILGPGDVAQEVTARVYEAVWTHQEEAPCGAGLPWLVDLARRAAIAQKRSLPPRPRPSGSQSHGPATAHPDEPPADWQPDLGVEEREALHLVYLRGYSAAEADQRLGWLPGTTVVTLQQAMLRLAELENDVVAGMEVHA